MGSTSPYRTGPGVVNAKQQIRTGRTLLEVSSC
jgi:hypothetical protein